MQNKGIEVVIGSDGSIEIEAVGFTGADCEKATAFLEKALGLVSSRNRKGEYYRGVLARKEQRTGQRAG